MAKKISIPEFDAAVEKYLSGIPMGTLLLQIPMDEDGEGHVHPVVITSIRNFMHVAMRMVTAPKIVNANVTEFAGRRVAMAPDIVKPKLQAFAEFLDAYCDEPYQPDGAFDESLLT